MQSTTVPPKRQGVVPMAARTSWRGVPGIRRQVGQFGDRIGYAMAHAARASASAQDPDVDGLPGVRFRPTAAA